MSLEVWARNGWLRPHKITRQEVVDLFGVVDRDLKDARRDLSTDWKFGIAYNASLQLCTILLNASGYRPEKLSAHHRTLQSLPLILGSVRNDDADYLDTCRKTRNTVEYDFAGVTTEADAKELIEFAERLRQDVRAWLKQNHPELC
jgi:uncharacterized protein (UPF0332 family)